MLWTHIQKAVAEIMPHSFKGFDDGRASKQKRQPIHTRQLP